MTALPWLFALAAIVSLDMRVLNPILPAVADALGVTPGHAGYAATSFTVSYGVMQLVWGPLADRVGRVRVVRGAALLFAATTALGGLAASLGLFVSARFLTGIFAAALIPTTFAYIGDTVRYEARHRMIGRFTAVMSTAQAMSSAVAGAVSQFVSWRYLYLGFAVAAVGVALPLFRAPDAAPAHAGAASRVSYAGILARARARSVYFCAFTEGVFIWGGTTYLGVLASRRLGMNDLQIGALLACYGLGTVIAGMTAAWPGRHFGDRAPALIGGGIQAIGWALLVPPLPWPVFAVSQLALGLGFGWLHSTIQTWATELVPEARGKAFSLFPLSFFMGGAVGTGAFGRLVDAGLIPLVMALCAAGMGAIGWYAGSTYTGAPRWPPSPPGARRGPA